MSISIVITAFNQRSLIERAIASCLASLDHAHELIVVDDGSEDGTREYLLTLPSHAKLKLVLNTTNKGTLLSRRIGSNHATGEYVLFLDGDDEIIPSGIAKLSTLITDSIYDLVLTTVMFTERINEYPKIQKIQKPPQITNCSFIAADTISAMHNYGIDGKLYRTKTLQKVWSTYEDITSTHLCYSEDAYMFVLHLCLSRSWASFDIPTYKYHANPDSITRRINRRDVYMRSKQINKTLKLIDSIDSQSIIKAQKDEGVIDIIKSRLSSDRVLMYRHTTNFSGRSLMKVATFKAYKLNKTPRSLARYIYAHVAKS